MGHVSTKPKRSARCPEGHAVVGPRSRSLRLARSTLALSMLALSMLALSTLGLACGPPPPRRWPGYDALSDKMPPPARTLGGVPVSEQDYQALLRLGEDLFRSATFGGERTVNDLLGLFGGEFEVPCPSPAPPGCVTRHKVLEVYARSVDALDGVEGNLFAGNGGFEGTGYTHDLVLRFPKGARLHGFALPEALHTGLDIEAGSAWPIGIVAVAAARQERDLPYLVDPATLGAGPAPTDDKYRLGITCAMCHYSLDVDWDGKTDLRSARLDQPTPGSLYKPWDAWPVGNQDLHIGWVIALSANPLLAFTIFSGPVGRDSHSDARAWVRWVRDHYQTSPEAVMREVVRGMLVHPRGYADVSPNARHDTEQFPPLFTRDNWPSNYDGALVHPGDRNSSVWTTTLDFTGLIGLAGDRAGAQAGALYWEPEDVYQELPAERFADLMVRYSPLVTHDPSQLRAIKDDILGTSDGVPGILDDDAVVVMEGPPGAIPDAILHDPRNVAAGRFRRASDYPGDAEARGPMLALLGLRARTPPAVLRRAGYKALKQRYPKLNADELASDAVSLALDWNRPPTNHSPLLRDAQGLVARGYEVFQQAGCADCHRGRFYTDNRIHRIAATRLGEFGLPRAPSTAGFRRPEHHLGPALDTQRSRAVGSRPLQLFVAPVYDPATGLAVSAGGPLEGFFGDKRVGYKTSPLFYLWGSAPYLHDGGVGVALRPGSAPDKTLAALLSHPAEDKLYGMGAILSRRERAPDSALRADAALSLQALVLRGERARVIAGNRELLMDVPQAPSALDLFAEPPAERISMRQLGVVGRGHDFYVDDVPGGERVTALVAFLLAIDDDLMALPTAAPASKASRVTP